MLGLLLSVDGSTCWLKLRLPLLIAHSQLLQTLPQQSQKIRALIGMDTADGAFIIGTKIISFVGEEFVVILLKGDVL